MSSSPRRDRGPESISSFSGTREYHGAPKEILAKAKKRTLDDAFISLLPPEKRGQHQEVIVPPRTESDDKTAAIETEGLTRRFGDFVAVDHVSVRIERGEIFGFLGSNGCGKTTTMKMMTGLLPVTEGSAKLFGKPMAADDMQRMQSPSIRPIDKGAPRWQQRSSSATTWPLSPW